MILIFKSLLYLVLFFIISCSSISKKQSYNINTFDVQYSVNRYVRSLGELLEGQSSRKLNAHYVVSESSIVQASVQIDSKFIEITAGMLLSMKNEAQLAGILAHEIGHLVLHKDADKELENKKRIIEQLEQLGLSIEIRKAFSSYWNKQKEQEADEFAAQLLVKAGYNPYEYVRLFKQLDSLDMSTSLEKMRFFRGSHYSLSERAKYLESYLKSKKIIDKGSASLGDFVMGISGIQLNDIGYDGELGDLEGLKSLLSELENSSNFSKKKYENATLLALELIEAYKLEFIFFEEHKFFMQELISISGPLVMSSVQFRLLGYLVKLAKLYKRYGKDLFKAFKKARSKKAVDSKDVKNKKFKRNNDRDKHPLQKASKERNWKLGEFKSAKKWSNQLKNRKWDEKQINELIRKGKKTNVPNRVNPKNKAIQYTDPKTGKYIVMDKRTREIIQLSGEKFRNTR